MDIEINFHTWVEKDSNEITLRRDKVNHLTIQGNKEQLTQSE